VAITPAIFDRNASTGRSGEDENIFQESAKKLDPFSGTKTDSNQIPFYVTGARALIRVGGKALGVAQRCKWNIAYSATPINTIDANFPWDIDIGQARIACDLSMIMDPTKGPEHDGVFHIMQSAIHQPFVELQILDRGLGTQYFFARGAFTELSGSVGIGEVGGWSARFVGVTYQHYVKQSFKPYTGVAGAASTLVDGLQGISSDLTGGIL